MWIVLCPWYGFNAPHCNDGAFDITGTTFDNLRTVIFELPFMLVQIDGVTDDGTDS